MLTGLPETNTCGTFAQLSYWRSWLHWSYSDAKLDCLKPFWMNSVHLNCRMWGMWLSWKWRRSCAVWSSAFVCFIFDVCTYSPLYARPKPLSPQCVKVANCYIRQRSSPPPPPRPPLFSLCLSVCLPVCLPIRLSICVSICLSISMAVCLSLSVHICLSMSVNGNICLGVDQFLQVSVIHKVAFAWAQHAFSAFLLFFMVS